MWKTTNAGASWTDWTGTGTTELPDAPVNALLVDSKAALVYAGTDIGVFVSSTATRVGPKLVRRRRRCLGIFAERASDGLQLFNPDAGTKTLVASTYGRGIWNYALVASPNYTNRDFEFAAEDVSERRGDVIEWDAHRVAWIHRKREVDLHARELRVHAKLTAQVTSAGFPLHQYTLAAGGSVGDYNFNFTIQGRTETRLPATPTEMLTWWALILRLWSLDSEYVDCGSIRISWDGNSR